MTATTRARILFGVCALWNFGGFLACMNMQLNIEKLHGSSMLDPVALAHAYGFWGFVGLSGIGFGIVAMDPSKNHGFVLFGTLGKIMAVGIFLWLRFHGYATNLILYLCVGDSFFILAFLWFLIRQTRRSS